MEPKSAKRTCFEDLAGRSIENLMLTWSSVLPLIMLMCKSAEANCEIWKLVMLAFCECLLEA